MEEKYSYNRSGFGEYGIPFAKVTLAGMDISQSLGLEVKITQTLLEHSTYEIKCSSEIFEDRYSYPLKNSLKHMGKSVLIQMRQWGETQSMFSGYIVDIKYAKEDGYPYVFLTAKSHSARLDSQKRSRSYVNMSLEEMVKSAYNEYVGQEVEMIITPRKKEKIPYTVSVNETIFEFLRRLAVRYGEFFYWNGIQLVFGRGKGNIIEIREKQDFHKFTLGASTANQYINYLSYHPETAETFWVDNHTQRQDRFGSLWQDKAHDFSRNMYPVQEHFKYFDSVSYDNGQAQDQKMQEHVKSLQNLVIMESETREPRLRLGDAARMQANVPEEEIFEEGLVPIETYFITELTISYTSEGYENIFKGIPVELEAAPYMDVNAFLRMGKQTAVVTENNDPQQMNRLKVRYFWMNQNEATPWVRTSQGYAGANRGLHMLPEIGDEVLLDYIGGCAEMPVVIASLNNGKAKSGYATPNNDIKALATRNTQRIANDGENKGSILERDGAGSFIKFGGNKETEINTETLTINVKRLIINAADSVEITTNDYILNALSRIYIFSSWMKQSISGFMNLFSKEALINSTEIIDIEAKETKLHGTEQSLVYSDKKAIVNSTGTAELYGIKGSKLSDAPIQIKKAATERIALAQVYFRPLEDWRGEYGFDWLREKDNGLAPVDDPAYENIIESGYKDGTDDLEKEEAYSQLKTEYQIIPIHKPAPLLQEEYYVPYLTLFSEQFVRGLIDPRITVKPQYKAKLKILINIEEELDKLEFEYDKAYLSLTGEITETTETGGLVESSAVVEITCLKDLNTDKEIKVYAYPKDCKQPRVERKLAGKLVILKNDKTVRKEEKFVLVSIWTDIARDGNKIKGEFTPEEKQNFYNSFHQALIIPSLEDSPNVLDLSTNADFQVRMVNGIRVEGKYIHTGTTLLDEDWELRNTDGTTRTNFFKEIQNLFFTDKDVSGNLKNENYTTDYFTVFSLAAEVYDEAKGQIGSEVIMEDGKLTDVFQKNLIIFPNKDFCTMNHEGLHGFNLRHTHRDSRPIDHPFYKYIFPEADVDYNGATTNIMSYRDEAYSSWRWQWSLLNSNIPKI